MTKDEFLKICLNPRDEVPKDFQWEYPPGRRLERTPRLSPAGERALRLTRTIPTSRGRRLFTIVVVEATLNRIEVFDALTNVARFTAVDWHLQERVHEVCVGAVRDAKVRYGILRPTEKAKRTHTANARQTMANVRQLLDNLRRGNIRRTPGDLFQAMLSAVRDACDLPGMSDPLDNFNRAIEVCREVLRVALFRYNHRMSGDMVLDGSAASREADEIIGTIHQAFAGVEWRILSNEQMTEYGSAMIGQTPWKPADRLKTAEVLGLAKRAFDTNDPGLLPILADALQDTGCEPPVYLRAGVLPSCRGLPIVEDLLGV